jgi:hypothetical protein
VLPSLGEDLVVQRPLEALGPLGVEVRGWDAPDVADLKGHPGMVDVCRRMLEEALPPLPERVRFTIGGVSATASRSTLHAIRRRGLGRVDPSRPGSRYHARADAVVDQLLAALRASWNAQRADHPTASADPSEDEFRDLVLEAPEIRMLMNNFWPRLDAVEILASYAQGRRRLDAVAEGLLSADDAARVHDAWGSAEGWTVEDVALLDELEALLGDPDPTTARREDDGPTPPDVEAHWYADFAHVVVDEAQDLSPMQWRAVVRRGPFASWTVVGDLAQRARDTHPRNWEEVAELIGRRQVVIETLATNYRTPSELAPLARRALALAGHDPDAFPVTVRSNGRSPLLEIDEDPVGRGLTRALARVLAGEGPRGTIGVVVPVGVLSEVQALVSEVLDDAASEVKVLDPRRVKGLEFDDLIVVAPERMLTASPLGAHDLYVALTRATRSLCIVSAEEDLAVLEGLGQA